MNRPMRRQKCEVTDPVKIEQIIKKAGVVHLGMEDLRYICMAQRKDANMT